MSEIVVAAVVVVMNLLILCLEVMEWHFPHVVPVLKGVIGWSEEFSVDQKSTRMLVYQIRIYPIVSISAIILLLTEKEVEMSKFYH